ncbi:hypothetical protein R2F61_08995 [Mollicutes bacterium LVI A0078]|nr:hypothetical protein RZE84_08770 [Mollicutes bacterium LVI A0075]WOO90837.1 hypothetical protein R2F61_08995 [Mollicutes bacterium LVI A0078]
MNNYFGALAYNDEKLYAVVYNSYEGQQYVIASREVHVGDITTLSGMEEIAKIGKKLNDVLGEVEDEIGTRIHRLDLIIEPIQFYYEAKTFEVEFEEIHTITPEDIKKIVDKAVRYDTAKSGYTTANFTPVNYVVDGVGKTNPIGAKGRKIVITGDLVFIDSNSLYPLERIIEDSRYRKQDTIISSHLLKYARGFNNNEAIIEFGRMKMKFMTKSENLVQNFNMDFGLGHIYQKTYMELVETHSPEDSEKVVRYMQNNFKLSDIKFDFEVAPGMTYSYVTEIFRKIASEYIQGIILQVFKQGIEFKKIYSITNDYANDEWVKFMKSILEIEIEEFKVNSVSGHFKQELKIFNAIAINDKNRLRG